MRRNASRALDVVVASVALAISAPLLAVAAVLIKLESRGPVFYRQRRVGLRGEPFELWKLRTMVPGAESIGAGIYVVEGDPRITRTGRLLRRLSLKPGITGWAQVNGRTSLPWPERIELDVWYVEHRSIRLDLRILAKTARLLATGRGLYSDELKQGW